MTAAFLIRTIAELRGWRSGCSHLDPPLAVVTVKLSALVVGARRSGHDEAVLDDRSGGTGVQEKIRIVVRDNGRVIKGDLTRTVAARGNFTFSTHPTSLFFEQVGISLGTGFVGQGTATILAATTNVVCTAMIMDASAAIPAFAVALHMQRFNPLAGTEE